MYEIMYGWTITLPDRNVTRMMKLAIELSILLLFFIQSPVFAASEPDSGFPAINSKPKFCNVTCSNIRSAADEIFNAGRLEHAKEYHKLNTILEDLKGTKYQLLKTEQYGKMTTGKISTTSAFGQSLQTLSPLLSIINTARTLSGLSIGSTAGWWVAVLSLRKEKIFEVLPIDEAEEVFTRLTLAKSGSIQFLEKALDSLACERLVGSSYVLNGLIFLAKQQCNVDLDEYIRTRTEIYGPVSSVEYKDTIQPLLQHCKNQKLPIPEQRVPDILRCEPKRWRLLTPEPNPNKGSLSESRGIITANCSPSAEELILNHRRVRNQKPTVDVKFKFSVSVPSEAKAGEVKKLELLLSVSGKHISENAGATGSLVGYKGITILSHGLKNGGEDAVMKKKAHASIRFPSALKGDDVFTFESHLVDGPGEVGENCRVRYSYKYK